MTSSADDAEQVFAGWLEAVEEGREIPFEKLVSTHPEFEADLRSMHDDWQLFAPMVERVVPGQIASDLGVTRPPLSLDLPADESDPAELIERLGVQIPDTKRYSFRAVLGRGGGGVVLRVWDKKLRRSLAMKIVLGRDGSAPTGATPPVGAAAMKRFVNEARISSQLDHPGIVPVHELGTDAGGRAFFTMRLVHGEDLSTVLAKVRDGRDGWSRVRMLGVLARVCEAVSYANSKGIVHRDLKPANVMVGRFGEVHVMDWGLARVRGARLDSEPVASAEGASDAPSDVTRMGHVLGTPAYMPPEQALGQVDRVDARSDVYAVGAMLYELLAGTAPFVLPDRGMARDELLEAVRLNRPRPIDARDVPPELIAIQEKAMARDPQARYTDLAALGTDLGAFLEGRVVQAHRTGARAELAAWIRRNRGTAIAVLVTAVVGAVLSLAYAVRAADSAELAEHRAQRLASTVREFNLLATVPLLERMRTDADGLQPPWPSRTEALRAWLADCDDLQTLRTDIDAALDELRDRSDASQSRSLIALYRQLRSLRPAQTRSENSAIAMTPTATEAAIDEAQGAMAAEVLASVLGEVTVGLDELKERRRAIVARDLRWSLAVERLTRENPRAPTTWGRAAAAIAAADGVTAHAQYAGFDASLLENGLLGLVPIGMNPVTRLWEFYHLRSAWDGESDPFLIPVPDHREDGSIEVGDDTGIVFVLLPAGTFLMGSQRDDQDAPNFNSRARLHEAPVVEVTLDAFMIARHELTQGQWMRLQSLDDVDSLPNAFKAGRQVYGPWITLANPVSRVSWTDCDALARRYGLELPTEAQWEYSCRAGTSSIWCCELADLQHFANVSDQSAISQLWGGHEAWNDTHLAHAPVGSFRPNLFGLYDMHGNVWEWCRDTWSNYKTTARPGDGLRGANAGSATVVYRGGSFRDTAESAGSANRGQDPRNFIGHLGLRAVRRVQRP